MALNGKNKMRKILLIQAAKLGDMVCTTPVFKAVKSAYPSAELIVMGDSLNRQVVAGNPHVSRYIELKDASPKLFRDMQLDAAVLLNANPSLLYFLIRARVRKIIAPKIIGGFSPYATKAYKFLCLFVTTIPHRFGHYAPQEYLNMLVPLGIKSEDTTKEVYFSREAEARAEALISDAKGKLKIAMSPSAGNKIKNWGGKNFAKVADELSQKWDSIIYIIGGERDTQEVEEMTGHLTAQTRVVNLSTRLTVDELKAFISKADLFVSVDTGPLYIAEALDVPTVDIIGPMDEREQPPQGPNNKLVYLRDRKEPMLHIMNARVYNYDEARRQIDEITPEMVIREADELLSRYKKSSPNE